MSLVLALVEEVAVVASSKQEVEKKTKRVWLIIIIPHFIILKNHL